MSPETLEQKFTHFSDLREAGQIEEAIAGYKSLLAEAEKTLFSEVPEMLAVTLRIQEKYQEALPYAQKSVDWAIKANDNKHQEANCRRDLAGILADLDRTDAAQQELQKSLKILVQENEGGLNALGGTLSFMAKLAAKAKDFDQAHVLNQAAISLTYPINLISPERAGQHYLFLLHEADIYYQESKSDQALDFARQALAGFEKLGQTHRRERAQKLIDQIQNPPSK